MSRTLTLPRIPVRRPRRALTAVATGVRIGATQVAVATADGAVAPLAARAGAVVPLPWGAVRDGEVVDAAAVATALRQATSDVPGLETRVRLGIGCQKVAVRVLDLPPVQDDADVPAAVALLARERIPTASDDAVLDHRLLPPAPDGTRRALVVAARRELVDGHVAAARAAGLTPVGIDLLAFGLSRAVGPQEPTLLLDLDGVATLALADADGCRFVRTVPAGLQSAADELADRLGVGAADAAALLAERPDDERAAAVDEVVERSVRAIAATARTSLDFHVEHEDGAAPTTCVTSGSLADRDGLPELLADALGIPVHPAARTSGVADPVALGLSVEEVRS